MVITNLPLLTLVAALSLSAAATDVNPQPQLLELNSGESVKVTLPGGKEKTLRLQSLREYTEPYFESAGTRVVNAVIKADLVLEVDGVRATVTGGPFRLPTVVNGLAILLSNTKNWNGGIVASPLAKDVRLEVADLPSRWTTAPNLTFPIRNYRWHAMNYQHSYLAVAVNQAKLYYHRGEDMGMIPDKEQCLAMTDLEVVKVPGPNGDGASNGVVLKTSTGYTIRYAHMNAPNIQPTLQPGVKVTGGALLGLTGNTWQGKPVSDPHLHVDLHEQATQTLRHSFPLMAAAYRASFPGEPLPIAGGWRHLYAGESIELDGSLSLPANGRTLRSFEWKFTDGAKAKGKTISRRYDKPGTYSEQLTVTDDKGKSDSDFVEVFVLPKDPKKGPPFAWINYYPVRDIKPGTEVSFLTRFSNLKDLTIDFGDGQSVPWALNTTHTYKKSGVYLVTVTGQDSGSGPGIFHVRVIVD
jgi:hypothetical protein